MSATQLRTLTSTLILALIAIVIVWRLAGGVTAVGLVTCIVLTCPLWAPLRGILRGNRKTYAWATLCVIPYFILGVTEAVANPERRLWPALCLAVALTLFGTLILYLRVTNPERAP